MLRTITVGELIELLEDQDRDAQVIFKCDYGDICHTEQAIGISGEVEEVEIAESGYSHSGYAIAEADPDSDEEEEPRNAPPVKEGPGEVEGNKYIVIW
jgi:hypothetical protein